MCLIKLKKGEWINQRNFNSKYVYNPYPKWVNLPNGSGKTVFNEHEEKLLISEGKEKTREELLKEANSLGLNPHHKLGTDKIKSLILQYKSSWRNK